MLTASIIQPGKIGDIIILIPVAKWYQDKGYDIVWPVCKSYIAMFQDAVPYVKFIPIDKISYNLAKMATGKVDLCVDTYFGFSDRKDVTDAWTKSGLTFDQYKYKLANVPFEQKFTLQIKRNHTNEYRLFSSLVKTSRYLVVHEEGSDRKRSLIEDKDKELFDQIITIRPVTSNIFDWTLILEKASAYKMIDSCFCNLASQLGFNVSGIRYWKPGYKHERHFPILNKYWTTIR